MSESNVNSTQIRLYNTLSQRVDVLAPKEPGKVGIYVCGPTVYDVPHAGHARSAVAFDVLVRHLKASALDVTFVKNITDIDDKILNRAQETSEEPLTLSARMTKVYQDDMAAIGCVSPTHEPRVSDHLNEIIALVQSLIEHNAAYTVTMPSGAVDVYFDVKAFAGYGKLSHRKLDEMEAGARVERSEHKRDPADFALWKGAPGEAYGWPSPWGKGRPGWHIECSAMSAKYLGFGFDIHGGGMDLIFPHHENEIAQSEAAHPHEGNFANLWMHNGFVNVDKEKMSKSLGNFVTVRDVLERNDAEGFRYFLLTVHYRGPLTFDTDKLEDGRVVFPGVDEAERRIDYLVTTVERLDALAEKDVTVSAKLPGELIPLRKVITSARGKVKAALDDDLNTPVALAAIAEMAKVSNDLCDIAQKRRKDKAMLGTIQGLASQALVTLLSCANVLGLLQCGVEDYTKRTRERRLRVRGIDAASIETRIGARTKARVDKDFALADSIRKELLAQGVEIADTPSGTEWRVGV